jgi:sigma-54-specific transcriptional regulator
VAAQRRIAGAIVLFLIILTLREKGMANQVIWPRTLLPGRDPQGAAAADWIFVDPHSRALLAEVEQVAGSDASILIHGETGTGKELIARHIHQRSSRRDGPFVVVSCGAFSESLVDAELFGHENGAFVGAFGSQAGWFEEASGGTIFFDEINDLPLSVQNKLLRVLQERSVTRLGSSKPIAVDLRILAATTVDLEELVKEKRFRKDLYYRLNVVALHVLTLKERPADIVPLARYFIDLYSQRLGYPRLPLTPEAARLLEQSSWPGNVRQLENVLHRSLLTANGSAIDVADLRLPPAGSDDSSAAARLADSASLPRDGMASSGDQNAALRHAVRALCESHAGQLYQAVEDVLFSEVFRYSHYSQSETASILGISRNVVRARLQRLGEIGTTRRTAAPVPLSFSNEDNPSTSTS